MRYLVSITAGLLATAAFAFADTQKKTDPKNDVNGLPPGEGFDFRSATVVHKGRDLYAHRVTSWYAHYGGVPFIHLQIGSGRGGASHYVAKPNGGKAGVFKLENGKRVADAKFTKHSNKSFTLKFSTAVLGFPEKYKWRWVIPSPGGRGFNDKLPDKGFVTHDVATGSD